MAEFVRDADFHAHIKRFKFVSSSSNLVCIGEGFGRYNYAFRSEAYPFENTHIPVRNRFGGVDYHPNPGYQPKAKNKEKK